MGLEHVNISTKKVVPASMGIRCGSDKCAKLFKRECQKVSGDVRHQIFTDYYSIGSLQLQSQFASRHVENVDKNAKLRQNNLVGLKQTYTFLQLKVKDLMHAKTCF